MPSGNLPPRGNLRGSRLVWHNDVLYAGAMRAEDAGGSAQSEGAGRLPFDDLGVGAMEGTTSGSRFGRARFSFRYRALLHPQHCSAAAPR